MSLKQILLQGKKFEDVFDWLHQKQRLLKVRLPSGSTQLTVISHLSKKWFNRCFYVEIDEDIAENPDVKKPLELFFEFQDQHNVPHAFKTQGVKCEQNLLKVTYPTDIERRQQRQFYRVDVPEDTFLRFYLNGRKHDIQVRDISLGGSFCVVSIEDQTSGPIPELKMNDEIENLQLQGTLTLECYTVFIARACVVRVHSTASQNVGFGIQFIELKRDQELMLARFVRAVEKYHLRRRMALKNNLV